MDEFIENFNEFRDWLYEVRDDCKQHDDMLNYGHIAAVIAKFEELGLDKAF